MGWFRKKKDPISARARTLQAEIEQLEARIQEMTAHGAAGGPPADKPQPRLRSTALPSGQRQARSPGPMSRAGAPEQVFEEVDHKRLQIAPDTGARSLYNEQGLRKFDLPEAWQRLTAFFRGSTAQHETFVKLLAAGNIQGLRPLRYEKRVARRRFIVFVVVLFLLLWGIIAMFLQP